MVDVLTIQADFVEFAADFLVTSILIGAVSLQFLQRLVGRGALLIERVISLPGQV